jgi:hypothetical protein
VLHIDPALFELIHKLAKLLVNPANVG